jgi:hypothetical protein
MNFYGKAPGAESEIRLESQTRCQRCGVGNCEYTHLDVEAHAPQAIACQLTKGVPECWRHVGDEHLRLANPQYHMRPGGPQVRARFFPDFFCGSAWN